MLSKEELAYGQQKNREYCYEQAKREQLEYKKSFCEFHNIPMCPWDDLDEYATDRRYEALCQMANITPW